MFGLTATAAHAAPSTPVTSTLVSANPADNVPHALNGAAYAFAEIGNTVYVGGSFTSVRAAAGTATARNYLFAYDRTSGALQTSFAPVLDGAVQALAVTPDGRLVAGGAFRTVNGVARRNLVALDPATGSTVTSWVGRGDGGLVRRLVVRGNSLYVAGAFHWVNGTQHSLLARLNATTGAIDPTFQIDASVARRGAELVWGLDVAPDGRTLVAVGNFTRVNGQARNQVVLVDMSGTPTVANWDTQRYVPPCASTTFPFYARDVDFADDGSYFVIAADGGRGTGAYCDTLTRWETGARGTALDATWVQDTGRDSITSVEAADNVVYLAGHFRWLNNANGTDNPGAGAVDRYGYGALNPINGMPMAWNPTRSGAPAGTVSWGPVVFELFRGATGLFAGFDSDGLGREYHGRLGMFPLAGGRTVAAVNAPSATPGFLYLGGGAAGTLTRVPFDGTALGAPVAGGQPNIVAPGAAFALGNRVYFARTDRTAGTNGQLWVTTFNRGAAGAPWLGSGYNAWFGASSLTGAFYLDGRMYYTVAGDDRLFARYLEPDGSVVGCTAFVVPTQGVAWGSVRGMTYAAGRIVHGTTGGALRAVPFAGASVDGAAAVTLATGSPAAAWSSPTLFYATS
ncbi:hypothetical protein J3R04_004135 [Spirilliplanes yamanashiensis]|nr:delta-60 repeat domain-containing protein [Spirilliplanes yamanashiensis]MDP9818165.1 hypothetical protein [Spirilliplanes yamanashiensis]